MKTFVTTEIETFLLAVDRHMTAPFQITVIGGAAAALAYKVVDYTKDIDTMGGKSLKPIELACRKAAEETGLNIPIEATGVADGPYNYEDRLMIVEIKGLKKLKVFVPEINDLALMKILRANANDIETVKQLHANHDLDFNVLVERFNDEMTHVIGSQRDIRLKFLATIESVFGETKMNRAAELIVKTWGR